MLIINRIVEVTSPIDKTIIGKHIDYRFSKTKTLRFLGPKLHSVDISTRGNNRINHRLTSRLDINVGILDRVKINRGTVCMKGPTTSPGNRPPIESRSIIIGHGGAIISQVMLET